MNNENLNEKLNKGISQIKNIRMTGGEKKHLLENIMHSTASDSQPILSPFANFRFFVAGFRDKNLSFMYYVAPVCLIFALGGGVGLASIGSLPGNALYGVKVNMVEPVSSFLKFSPEARARYESNLATERLMEAEALAFDGKLNDVKEKILSRLLEQHTNNLNNYREQLPQNNQLEKVDDDIVAGFEHRINEHIQNLDRIRNKETNNNEDEKIEKKETIITKTAKASVAKVKGVTQNITPNKTKK